MRSSKKKTLKIKHNYDRILRSREKKNDRINLKLKIKRKKRKVKDDYFLKMLISWFTRFGCATSETNRAVFVIIWKPLQRIDIQKFGEIAPKTKVIPLFIYELNFAANYWRDTEPNFNRSIGKTHSMNTVFLVFGSISSMYGRQISLA